MLFVGADLDALERAVVFGIAVVFTGSHSAFDAMIGMTVVH